MFWNICYLQKGKHNYEKSFKKKETSTIIVSHKNFGFSNLSNDHRKRIT